jgi:multiple sugar transport system substrate-binding protein
VRIRSRLTKVLAAATAVAALAACSSGASSSGGASAGSGGGGSTGSSTKPVSLSWFMWSGSNEEVTAWKHVGDLVHQKYPNITVNFQTTDFNDYWTKLTTEAASGDAPCVVGLQGQRAPQFGNLLIGLNSYLTQLGIKGSDFGPTIYKGLQYGGQQVALPYDYGPFVMFYNKDAFKAAGLKAPAIGWTTADFIADAKALTKAPKYGFFAGSDISALEPWVLSASGKSALNSAGKLDIDNAAWKSAAEFYTDLITKDKVAAQIPSANSSAASANQFLAGNAYMTLDGPWDLINARALSKFGVGIAPMPAGAAGSKTWSDGSGFGVTKDCKDPADAAKAVSVMTGVAAETYLGNLGRAFPARLAQQTAWYTGNKTQDVKPVMDFALANAIPYTTISTWQQVDTAFSKEAVAVYNGQGSVDDLLSQAQAQSGN